MHVVSAIKTHEDFGNKNQLAFYKKAKEAIENKLSIINKIFKKY